MPAYIIAHAETVGAWFSGRTEVSKTFDEGSIPSAPATQQIGVARRLFCWWHGADTTFRLYPLRFCRMVTQRSSMTSQRTKLAVRKRTSTRSLLNTAHTIFPRNIQSTITMSKKCLSISDALMDSTHSRMMIWRITPGSGRCSKKSVVIIIWNSLASRSLTGTCGNLARHISPRNIVKIRFAFGARPRFVNLLW